MMMLSPASSGAVAAVPTVVPFASAAPDTYAGTPAAPEALAPSTLAVPDAGIRVAVTEQNADAKGALTIPDDPDHAKYKAAHYTGSAPLGAAAGSTFIAAHVNFDDNTLAPFAALAHVAKGTPVYVSDAQGVVHRYKVTSLTEYREDALPAALYATDGPPQLVLLTCNLSSPWVPIDGKTQFAERTALTATPWA